jgi:hypothetical protein
MDQYLRLNKGLNPGNSFQQMMQSRKRGGQGRSGEAGQGEGQSGESGFAISSEPTTDIMGNESSITSNSGSKQKGKPGAGQGLANPDANGVAFDKPDTVKGVTPVNRESGAVNSETTVEEYRDLVEKYFKKITK